MWYATEQSRSFLVFFSRRGRRHDEASEGFPPVLAFPSSYLIEVPNVAHNGAENMYFESVSILKQHWNETKTP